MQSTQRTGVAVSLILHLAGLAWLAFVTFVWAGFGHEEAHPAIFTMVAGPQGSAAAPAGNPQGAGGVADSAPDTGADFPDLAMPEIPEAPAVVEPPPPPPAAKPAPKTAQKSADKPKPAPPKTMSYAEFLKTKDGKRVAQSGKTATRAPSHSRGKGDRVKIDTSGIRKSLSEIAMDGGGGFGTGGGAGGELARYMTRLRARIDANWQKPDDSESYGRSAVVAFTVGKNGRIASRTLKKSSGSRAFDAAALAAFDNLGYVGAPPVGGTFLLEFNTEE